MLSFTLKIETTNGRGDAPLA